MRGLAPFATPPGSHTLEGVECPSPELITQATGPQGLDPAVTAHVAGCPRCAKLLAHGEATAELGAGARPAEEPEDPLLQLPRGTLVGRYVLGERLGAGGMGVVYSARDPELARDVAVKFVLRQAETLTQSSGQAFLLREAQSLAKLSHPNVVAVYDAGLFQERVFIAMELVKGQTLRQWLKAAPRPWEEVVERFAAAGRGLAAAHRKGLVHRDFKPDNVLVDPETGVRVMDFGLAKPTDEAPAPNAPLGLAAGTLGSGASILTGAGRVLGTPAYLSPEQVDGKPADARCDQYAFGISLYEALYGARPFASPAQARERKWQLPPAPRSARVPARIRRVLLRMLAVDPQARFPDMDAVVRQLATDFVARRRRTLAYGAVLVLAAAGVAYARWSGARQSLCSGAERKLEGVWSEPLRRKMEASFLATGLPFAKDALGRTQGLLSAYGEAWVAQHTDACEATRLRGEQSEEVMTQRMACLERRRRELGALVEVLANADAPAVLKATRAAYELPPLSACADLDSLRDQGSAPADPKLREQLDALQGKLAQARALNAAGRVSQAQPVLEQVAEETGRLKLRPLETETNYALGRLLAAKQEHAAAVKAFFASRLAAEAGAVREGMMLAATSMAGTEADQGHLAEADRWVALARAGLESLGAPRRLEAELELTLGMVSGARDDTGPWLEHSRKAVELIHQEYGEVSPKLAAAYNNLGIAYGRANQAQEAIAAYTRSAALWSQVSGPQHPNTGVPLQNMSGLLQSLGRAEEAVVALQKVLAVNEAAYGPQAVAVATTRHALSDPLRKLGRNAESLAHTEAAARIYLASQGETTITAIVLEGLAFDLSVAGRYDEALEHSRHALAIQEKLLGPDHISRAYAHQNLADVSLRAERPAGVRQHLLAALEIWKKSNDGKDPNVAFAHDGLGRLALLERRPREAIGHFQAALAARGGEKTEAPEADGIWVGLGNAHEALRDYARAQAAFERALTLGQQGAESAGVQAETRFALARVLWAKSPRDEAAARAQLALARDGLKARGAKEELAKLEAWAAGKLR